MGLLEAKVGDLKGQVATRFGVDRKQLDRIQKQLEAQLHRLTGGVTGGIKLPTL